MMARAFNKVQRFALWHLAEGHCKECGKKLGRDFHADHAIPWSKGGATDVMNGRALCANCNLMKGSKDMVTRMVFETLKIVLRKWQQRAISVALDRFKRVSTVVVHATMAAGKTTFGAALAAEMRLAGVKRLVVVTTSINLVGSWVERASECGIQLQSDIDFDNPLPDGYDGLVITYARLCSDRVAEFLRGWSTAETTLVILDEPHHLSDNKPENTPEGRDVGWGQNAIKAFNESSFRLLMTGTPWRSDGTKIPFVQYGPDGILLTDFAYTYKDALRDDPCVVRSVEFPTLDSATTYQLRNKLHDYPTFEEVPKYQRSWSLRTAFDPDGDWIPSAISTAHSILMEMRMDDPSAGALIVVSDTDQAVEIADKIKDLTGTDAVIVTSKIKDAHERIEAFRKSSDCWLVAVQMVSEGVDIPRLRVGVYATAISTRLAFRQFVGRFLRVSEGRDYEHAVVIVPRTTYLVEYVKEFADEVYEALKEEFESDGNGHGDGNGDRLPWAFLPVGATGDLREIYQAGESFSQSEISAALSFQNQFPALKRCSSAEVARMLRAMRGSAPVWTEPAAQERPLQIRIRELRSSFSKSVKRLVFKRHTSPPDRPTQEDYRNAQIAINKMVGARSINSMTEDQLKEALNIVAQLLEEVCA